MLDLPGQELFQYEDDDGNPHAVDWSDVNDYLQAVTGADYTAKDFRTWAGTILSEPAGGSRRPRAVTTAIGVE